jgi:hypothetical protein
MITGHGSACKGSSGCLSGGVTCFLCVIDVDMLVKAHHRDSSQSLPVAGGECCLRA